ncbi:nucleoside monophosphate kinase [Microbulbifer sp. YPW16]|uniref:nucleoside monophosphate kinase n=1 Tax=Microbulbifer sp. YPW16 TaxID=2904242 RepID=UPI001E5396E4|nr:nucleoside monophosphate kinase [Microbulbifer sp. YPW16]UHQ55429.1 nucleoside monophosphate kinase [Microbulbifer sp. YPW16]
MKIIFTSPFNPLWSEGVSKMASLLEAEVVSIGNLLRAEVKSNTKLGKEIETALYGGEILSADIVSKLLLHRFFRDSARKILVNYPINTMQAESLVESMKKSEYGVTACVVVDSTKKVITRKFESQFHCADPLHPSLESSAGIPECEVCGRPMIHSYDLSNDKVAYLIDSYFNENGVLSSASTLSEKLRVETFWFTTPEEVVNQIQGLSHENA